MNVQKTCKKRKRKKEKKEDEENKKKKEKKEEEDRKKKEKPKFDKESASKRNRKLVSENPIPRVMSASTAAKKEMQRKNKTITLKVGLLHYHVKKMLDGRV